MKYFTGWGDTSPLQRDNNMILMEMDTRVLPNEVCKTKLLARHIEYNENAMMCAQEEFTSVCFVSFLIFNLKYFFKLISI